MREVLRVTASLSCFLFLFSCSPDCREVIIQKAEWKTRYENYYVLKDTIIEAREYVDTLVSYSILEHQVIAKHQKNNKGEVNNSTLVHYITVKNNNKSYSNSFAIKLVGQQYNVSSGDWKDVYKSTGFVSISPQHTHTFTIEHPSWWRNYYTGADENNITIFVQQKPTYVCKTSKDIKQIKQKKIKRIDNLILSDTIVNNCDCNVEELAQKYATIRYLFDRFKSEKLIVSDTIVGTTTMDEKKNKAKGKIKKNNI